MIYDAGRFNRRIEIYKNEMVENELLALEQQEVLYRKAWAMITQKKTRTQTSTGVDIETAINRMFVTIRYDKNIQKDMIVIINGDRYDVKTVANIGYNNTYTEMMCEKASE